MPSSARFPFVRLGLAWLSWLGLLSSCAVRAPCPATAPHDRSLDAAQRAGQQPGPIRVAITIDDVPGTAETPAEYPRSRVMANIIAALKAHRITAAVGFVNGIAAADADAQGALSAWIRAGYAVGNHTYSHRSARALSPAEFLADVARNQDLIDSQKPAAAARYFRFPYLERGRSEAERITITHSLAEQGYRVANVSIDFADWAFVPAYNRCLPRADTAALKSLAEGYLQQAHAGLFWSVEAAERVFGRSIPHVLLLHAHAASADNLDALLTDYENAGVVWIPLAEALSDPAYAEPPDEDHGDAQVITEAAYRRHVALRSSVPRSIPLLDLACR